MWPPASGIATTPQPLIEQAARLEVLGLLQEALSPAYESLLGDEPFSPRAQEVRELHAA